MKRSVESFVTCCFLVLLCFEKPVSALSIDSIPTEVVGKVSIAVSIEGVKLIYNYLRSGQKDSDAKKHFESIESTIEQGIRDFKSNGQEDHNLLRLFEINTHVLAIWRDLIKLEKLSDPTKKQIALKNFVNIYRNIQLLKDINFIEGAVTETDFGTKPLLESFKERSQCQTDKLVDYKNSYLKLYTICSLLKAIFYHYSEESGSNNVEIIFENDRYKEIESAFLELIEECKNPEQIKPFLEKGLQVVTSLSEYGIELSRGYPHVWTIITFFKKPVKSQRLHYKQGSLVIHHNNKLLVYGLEGHTLDENDQISVKRLVNETIKETKCVDSNFSACCSEDVEKALQKNGFKAKTLVAFIDEDVVDEFQKAGLHATVVEFAMINLNNCRGWRCKPYKFLGFLGVFHLPEGTFRIYLDARKTDQTIAEEKYDTV